MIAVHQALKRAREALGLSAASVAEAVGLNTAVLLRYESGQMDIPGDVLWGLSETLGVPFEEIADEATLTKHLSALSVRLKADQPALSEATRLAIARAAVAAR